jgi:hypothetical protein
MTLNSLAHAILLAGLVASAQAADTSSSPTPAAAPADGLQSLRAVRDKETGRLRAPTAEEAKAMAAAEREARKGEPQRTVILRQHANGMKSAVLTPEYLSTLKAERQPDGKLAITHADPADEHAGHASQQHPTK